MTSAFSSVSSKLPPLYTYPVTLLAYSKKPEVASPFFYLFKAKEKGRRIFLRLSPAADGGTQVELGGLARTDRAGWGPEFDRIGRSVLELPDADEVEEDDLVDDDIINVAPR